MQTLHRNAVKDVIRGFLSCPHDLSAYGNGLGLAIEKAKAKRIELAETDPQYSNVQKAISEKETALDKAVSPRAEQASIALFGESFSPDDLNLARDMIIRRDFQTQANEIAEMYTTLDKLASTHDDQAASFGTVDYMGEDLSLKAFPQPNTAYIIRNNIAQGWMKMAFCYDGDSEQRVFLRENGQWVELAQLAPFALSSKRHCQKVHYILNSQGIDKVVELFGLNDDLALNGNYNPWVGVVPGQSAKCKTYVLKEWMKAEKVKMSK